MMTDAIQLRRERLGLVPRQGFGVSVCWQGVGSVWSSSVYYRGWSVVRVNVCGGFGVTGVFRGLCIGVILDDGTPSLNIHRYFLRFVTVAITTV